MSKKLRFNSAVSIWYYFLLLLVLPGILILTGIDLHTQHLLIQMAYGVFALVAIGISLWILFRTCYTIETGTLRIVSGPFKWIIPLDEVKEVRASRSVLSSPALSLNRLEIRYGKNKSILVSPKDLQGFKNAIKKARGLGKQ